MDFYWNTRQEGDHIYWERGNGLINELAFVSKNMSRDCWKQWWWKNRTNKRNNEIKGEIRRKERKKSRIKERKNERESK